MKQPCKDHLCTSMFLERHKEELVDILLVYACVYERKEGRKEVFTLFWAISLFSRAILASCFSLFDRLTQQIAGESLCTISVSLA